MKAIPHSIPRKWSWHYGELMRRRDALLRERTEHDAAAREMRERGGTDEVDLANENFVHDTLVAEISQEHTELLEVEAAMVRIEQGTYGICEETGEAIGVDRLRAIPWTRYSRDAAARHERSKSPGGLGR